MRFSRNLKENALNNGNLELIKYSYYKDQHSRLDNLISHEITVVNSNLH